MRLGEILIARGKLDAAGVERALRLQKEGGEKLGALLVTLGLCAQRDVSEALAAQLGLPLVDAGGYPGISDPRGAHLARASCARRARCRCERTRASWRSRWPIRRTATRSARSSMVTGRDVKPQVAIPSELDAALERLYGAGRTAVGQIVGDVEQRDELAFDADVQHLKDLASEAPVIRLVSLIITNALEARASDIHIEPFENRLAVRYRIDGVLHEVESPPRRFSAAVISRVKIMANLDIAERRLPQDGRIRLRVQGKEIDLRDLDRADDARRIGGHADPRQGRRRARLRAARLRGRHRSSGSSTCSMQPHGILLVTGPDRLRQDDDALHGARAPEPARREDPDRRGSGRVPDAGHQPDPGEAADRPHVRQRAALDRAAGSRRDHDRRDPRPRDRARSPCSRR